MVDINLSKAVRSNLSSLQNTASLMSKTSDRLSTGNKVNSALDNPTNFFTASSLNSRAGDLNQLMDSVGNAIKTIEAADKGIGAITKLVESAQSTARQALQASAPSTTKTFSGVIPADVAATKSSTAAFSTMANTTTLTINDGSGEKTYTKNTTANASTRTFSTLAELEDLLRNDGVKATASLDSGNLKITATDNKTTLVIGGSNALTGLNGTYKPTNAALGGTAAAAGTLDGETLSIVAGGRAEVPLAFGYDAGEISNRQELETALSNLKGVDGSLVDGKITLKTKGGESFALTGTGADINTTLGFANGTTKASGESRRSEFITQYNELLTQIDQLSKDAGFNGINLLAGDDLQVTFNEDGSSKLEIDGSTKNASGLGLQQITDTEAWNNNGGINATLASLKDATESLRTQASKFGSNLSIVQNRQDFTKNMINVLETGAGNLTLADMNQEAANMMALQTRQSLASSTLSMANQADQSVLQLLR